MTVSLSSSITFLGMIIKQTRSPFSACKQRCASVSFSPKARPWWQLFLLLAITLQDLPQEWFVCWCHVKLKRTIKLLRWWQKLCFRVGAEGAEVCRMLALSPLVIPWTDKLLITQTAVMDSVVQKRCLWQDQMQYMMLIYAELIWNHINIHKACLCVIFCGVWV